MNEWKLVDKFKGIVDDCELDESGVQAFFNHKKKVAIILIPKCGTQSIEWACKRTEMSLESMKYIEGFKYVAMLRDPVERFASGFATWLAIQCRDEKISEEEAMNVIRDSECLDFIFRKGVFDIHTRLQSTFINPVKDSIELFATENKGDFYRWLRDNKSPIQNVVIHKTLHFNRDLIHYRLYNAMNELIEDPERRAMIEKIYREDINLYERIAK